MKSEEELAKEAKERLEKLEVSFVSTFLCDYLKDMFVFF
jgi:hypothetical protein